MLRVLVDYQRRRATAKRGGDQQRITLSLDDPAIAAHCAATCATAPLSACRMRRLLLVALALAVMAVALGVSLFLKT